MSAKDASRDPVCDTCDGFGWIEEHWVDLYGVQHRSVTCPDCGVTEADWDDVLTDRFGGEAA